MVVVEEEDLFEVDWVDWVDWKGKKKVVVVEEEEEVLN